MSGDVDYLMKVVVADVEGYDRFYKRLIKAVRLTDVSSAFAMEQIKYSTELFRWRSDCVVARPLEAASESFRSPSRSSLGGRVKPGHDGIGQAAPRSGSCFQYTYELTIATAALAVTVAAQREVAGPPTANGEAHRERRDQH